MYVEITCFFNHSQHNRYYIWIIQNKIHKFNILERLATRENQQLSALLRNELYWKVFSHALKTPANA